MNAEEESGEINFTGSSSHNNLQNKINSMQPYALNVNNNKLDLDKFSLFKKDSEKVHQSQDVNLDKFE
jgi:hypothetical protein